MTKDNAWVFPSERMTPMSKDNCWNRSIKPKLAKVGLAWANFLVMRRTHSTLMGELGIDGKLVADNADTRSTSVRTFTVSLRSQVGCRR